MNGLGSITLNGDSRSGIIVSTDNRSKIREIAMRSFKLYFPLNLLTPHLDRRSLVVYNPVDFRKLAIQFLKNQKAMTVNVDFRSLLIERVAKEISNIKFTLGQIESRYDNSGLFIFELREELTNLKTRLAQVTTFNERLQDDFDFIDSKIVNLSARFLGNFRPSGRVWIYSWE